MGTSLQLDAGVLLKKDHPHACGDKNFTFSSAPIMTGSSPRVWGQVNTLYAFPVILRIIPTRVGTSTDNPNDIIDTEDHPHACGDKFKASETLSLSAGSSPRVWGQVR